MPHIDISGVLLFIPQHPGGIVRVVHAREKFRAQFKALLSTEEVCGGLATFKAMFSNEGVVGAIVDCFVVEAVVDGEVFHLWVDELGEVAVDVGAEGRRSGGEEEKKGGDEEEEGGVE